MKFSFFHITAQWVRLRRADDGNLVTIVVVQISRLAVDSCGLYADCESCVSSQDLLGCVWCSAQCVVRSECRLSHFDPQQPHDTHCPPVIRNVRLLSVMNSHDTTH